MTSQFDLTRFYDVIIRYSVFQLGFLTRELQIPELPSYIPAEFEFFLKSLATF